MSYYQNGDLSLDGSVLRIKGGSVVLDYRRALNIASALLQFATAIKEADR